MFFIYSKKQKKTIEKYKKHEYGKYFCLDVIRVKIRTLFMISRILENHREEIDDDIKRHLDENDLLAIELVLPYIYSEIKEFYTKINSLQKNKEIDFGIKIEEEIPYWTTLEKFRHITGFHTDEDVKKHFQMFENLNKIGFHKIVNDFNKINKKIISKCEEKNEINFRAPSGI